MKPATTGHEDFRSVSHFPILNGLHTFLALATTPEQPLRSALADGQSYWLDIGQMKKQKLEEILPQSQPAHPHANPRLA
jgi:hypothetical protein